MGPVSLIRAVSEHLEAVELRVRKEDLGERDLAVIRLQLDAAQVKLAGTLDLLARR